MSRFQNNPDAIVWKLHFRAPPADVYQALSTDSGRRQYWAETADETDGDIHYVFLNGIENTGRILAAQPERRFRVTYFGWTVTFELATDDDGGTDLTMTCEGVADEDRVEVIAGWISWLMAMKGAVDFGIDLRNHDPSRTWFSGYADN